MPPVKPDALPLPALLSAAFVAFTVEADNAFEQQLPHRTTSFGASAERGAVWLTSLAMWFNCVRGLMASVDFLISSCPGGWREAAQYALVVDERASGGVGTAGRCPSPRGRLSGEGQPRADRGCCVDMARCVTS